MEFKVTISVDKILDQIGKIGVMLVTGGIGGAIFTQTVPVSVAVTAVFIGVVFGIIGSLKIKTDQEG